MEMGTGKTKVAIDNIAMLYDHGKINGALIIAPKVYTKTGTHKKYLNTYLNILNLPLCYGNH